MSKKLLKYLRSVLKIFNSNSQKHSIESSRLFTTFICLEIYRNILICLRLWLQTYFYFLFLSEENLLFVIITRMRRIYRTAALQRASRRSMEYCRRPATASKHSHWWRWWWRQKSARLFRTRQFISTANAFHSKLSFGNAPRQLFEAIQGPFYFGQKLISKVYSFILFNAIRLLAWCIETRPEHFPPRCFGRVSLMRWAKRAKFWATRE